MKETIKTNACDRANDLISFLYDEASDAEAQSFEQHLALCRTCQNEISSFGQLRESIGGWKAEALNTFASQAAMTPVRRKSALAAIRQFFDLSPLWLKGAVALASILFCAMVVLLVARSEKPQPQLVIDQGQKFTQQQVEEKLATALKKQAEEIALATRKSEETTTNRNLPVGSTTAHSQNRASRSTQWAGVRRPLSKSEKEQLASDLRLSSSREDDDNLKLLTDRINQEF